jgi:hypothetical protein
MRKWVIITFDILKKIIPIIAEYNTIFKKNAVQFSSPMESPLKKERLLVYIGLMRLRIIILVLALFAFLSASTGGWLYYFSYREAAFQKTESDAYTRLTLLTQAIVHPSFRTY